MLKFNPLSYDKFDSVMSITIPGTGLVTTPLKNYYSNNKSLYTQSLQCACVDSLEIHSNHTGNLSICFKKNTAAVIIKTAL